MVGALRAGWEHVEGIEREAEFVEIAKARLARWAEVPASMDESEVTAAAEKPDDRQVSLFGTK